MRIKDLESVNAPYLGVLHDDLSVETNAKSVDICRLSGYRLHTPHPGPRPTQGDPSLTLTVAPPELQPATASSALIVETEATLVDDQIEEPMNYAPIPLGRLAGPTFPEERWPAGSGPLAGVAELDGDTWRLVD
jgi:hypothetical protein